MSADLSLVADIGGTNTRVALATGAEVDAASVRRYANAGVPGLEDTLSRYLSEAGVDHADISGVCVAAAGPVRDGVAQLTNLDWRVDREVLTGVLSARKVAVLNDLQAQGHAIGYLDASAYLALVPRAEANPQAAKLVVGVGTGFNAAPVYDTTVGRFVPPSECGHVCLPTCGPDADRLARMLEAEHGFAAVEEALSGRGIGAIHRCLHGTDLPAAQIMAALQQGDPRAEATVRMFAQILGTVVGDLALIHLPFGGIYLVGGVARSVAPWLDRFGFASAMRAKGRFGPFLEQFGVSVVTDDYAALRGCASHLSHL